jgi:LysM repeat protein
MMKINPQGNLFQRGTLILLSAVLILSLLGASAPQPVLAAKCAATHFVKAGDTLAKISDYYDVPVKDIAAANNLTQPYTISIGQALCIPEKTTSSGSTGNCIVKHTVVAGDTINYLAELYKVDWRDIVKVNELKEPYALIIGQVLCIPGATKPGSGDTSTGSKDKAKPTLTVTGGFDIIGLELKNFPHETTYYVRIANAPENDPFYRIGRLRTDKTGAFSGYFNLPMYFPNSRHITVCLKNVWNDALGCVNYNNPYKNFVWEADMFCRLPRNVLRR